MKGTIERVPFGTIMFAEPSSPVLVQATYSRDCGCMVVTGFALTSELIAHIEGGGAVDKDLAHDAAQTGLLPCGGHRDLGPIWLDRFQRSIDEKPEDRDVTEVAADYLDEVLP